MNKHKEKRRHACELNLTSMLDVVFLLIVFFLLVSQFAEPLPDLDLPRPDQPQAKAAPQKRVVVSILPDHRGAAAAGVVQVEGDRVPAGASGQITDALRRLARGAGGPENLVIDLRADARLGYGEIAGVVDAITEAEIPRINLVTEDGP